MVNYIEIICTAGDGGPFRAGRLIVSIDGEWNIARRSVLLRLNPSVQTQATTSCFRPLDQRSIDYDLLKSWIHNCEQNHAGSCAHQHVRSDMSSDDVPGFRVIDCFERTVRKQTTSGINYVALSCIWGSTPHDPAQAASQFEAIDGKLPPNLPPTIADATSLSLLSLDLGIYGSTSTVSTKAMPASFTHRFQ